MRRDWLDLGAEYHEGETGRFGQSRPRVEAAIAALTWKPVPAGADGMRLPMSPGLAIEACIEQLKLPKVSAVAHDGYLQWPDGPETAHFSILGIEANYSNGRARVYVLDTGTGCTPLAADFWASEEAAA
jgi:hypothetical protein